MKKNGQSLADIKNKQYLCIAFEKKGKTIRGVAQSG
jgi:hypothetical protein